MADAARKGVAFWRGVCGCTLGGWSALAALAYCVAAAPYSADGPWFRIAASVGIVLAAAVVGKLGALAAARAVLAVLER